MSKTFAEWFGEDLTGQTYDGDITCSREGLTSLKGAPKIVKGSFWCDKNKLTSLEGGPQEVGKNFDCSGNQLTSLKGGPQKVGEMYECDNNKLTSLEGAPKETGSFSCFKNQLTSLKGAPKEVWGNFYCYDNPLTSLEGKPQMIYLDFRSDFDKKSTNNSSNDDDFGEAPPFSLNNDLPPEVEDFLFDETYYSDVPEMGDFVEENSDKEFMTFEVPDLMEEIRGFASNAAKQGLINSDEFDRISNEINEFLEDNADYFNESKTSVAESNLLRDIRKILNEESKESKKPEKLVSGNTYSIYKPIMISDDITVFDKKEQEIIKKNGWLNKKGEIILPKGTKVVYIERGRYDDVFETKDGKISFDTAISDDFSDFLEV